MPLIVGTGELNNLPLYIKQRYGRPVIVIVLDKNLSALYQSQLDALLQQTGIKAVFCLIDEGEEHKNPYNLNKIYDCLHRSFFKRSDLLIAFGGGITGDLATFAAATYNRGCRLIQIPTTLLAQTDSALGGKGAYNYQNCKNLIGVFYEADFILVDPSLLKTLNSHYLSDGFAEVLKYALIADKKLFNELKNLSKENFIDKASPIIRRCLAIKKALVRRDPFDHSVRAKLNYGHTLGHALEVSSRHYLSHGQAVGLGMLGSMKLAAQLGLTRDLSDELIPILSAWGLPVSIDPAYKANLFAVMRSDKKAVNTAIRMIFVDKIGHSIIRPVPLETLEAWTKTL